METLTLRTLEAARRFPLEPAEEPRRRRVDGGACAIDGTPLVPVLITTFGAAGDPSVWRAYPLAVEAFRCARGDHFEYAFLAPEEVQQLQAESIAAARGGDLDGAEFRLRRVVASWTGYAPARVNLASVYLDRVRVAQRQQAPAAEIQRLVDVAAQQLERALACAPPAPPEASVMLASIYVRRGRAREARALLEALFEGAGPPDAIADRATELLDELDALDDRARPAPSASPPPPASIAHPYLRLALPAGWTRAEDDEGYFALFDGPDHELVNVVVQELPAPCDVEGHLARVLAAHEQTVRRNYPRCDAGPPIAFAAPPGLRELRRRFRVEGNGPSWTVFTRYVLSEQPVMLRDGRRVHPYVQITHYGAAMLPSKELLDALGGAVVVPVLFEGPSGGSDALIPYLIGDEHLARRDAALRAQGAAPEGARGLLPLARGAFLTVAVDRPEGAQPLFGADLAALGGLDLAHALARAKPALEARLGRAELPLRLHATTPFAIPPVWREGLHAIVQGTATAQILVVGPSWMAAAAATTGALFRRASELLGTRALRALIPHRDRAFVFAAAPDPRADEALVRGILRAEADGERRLSDALFVLDPDGLSPLGPDALQWTVLAARKAATRAEIEARLPADAEARWVTGQPGTRDELRFAHRRAPPFSVRYQFDGDALFGVVIFAAVRGDFERLRELDAALREALPDCDLRMTGNVPYSLERARPIVEHALSQRLPTGTPIEVTLPGLGWMFGKVFGATEHGEPGGRVYGFELRYKPGDLGAQAR